MKALACVLLSTTAAISAASCAAVWGFDDASLASDGGALAVTDAATDQGVSDSGVLRVDAGTTDAAPLTPPDGAVREGMSPVCTPPCGPYSACERAVGNVATCVDLTKTCTGNVDCQPAGCCVLIEDDSGVGWCQSGAEPGAPVRVCGHS